MSEDFVPPTCCCICKKVKRLWTCDQCNSDAFCDECWDLERPHRQGAKGRGGIPHEKTDQEVISFLQEVLGTSKTVEEQQSLHDNDIDTIWFGVERDATNAPSFHDHGRYAALMADSIGDHAGPRYPELVSFIGQTGAGKSTLIKMLIDHQERALRTKDRTKDNIRFASPVVGSVDDHIPTTGDVHLYADPGSYLGESPMLYADCKGLDGGDNLPRGASNDPDILSKIKKGANVVKRTIDWATDAETRRRGFAVGELYPRLLYTFSDTVVFVLRNSKVFESIVLEQLLKWAEASINKSVNQPALPHAVIVLNATDNTIDPKQWDPEEATKKLMTDIAGAIWRVPHIQELAYRWRTYRGKTINNTKDLLCCYYSSVTVVRIPTTGRWMLINEQIEKLHTQIRRRCKESKVRKQEVRMSLTSDSLDGFLQSAFDHFSKNLDTAFDFMKESIKNNPIPQDFRGNLLKLVIAVQKYNSFPDREDAPRIFEHISSLVASCIMLDYVRYETLGTGEQLLEQHYLGLCEDVLRDFCGKHWLCSFKHPRYGRCINAKYGHSQKGHQNSSGRILGHGEYVSKFGFDSYKEQWKAHLRQNLKTSEQLRKVRASDNRLSPIAAASQVHKEVVNTFFNDIGGASKFLSNSICFCCLRELPEHPLPCGHILCSPCVQAYSNRIDGGLITLNACPLHEQETTQVTPMEIRIKPDHAGVRALCLDGGGVRGIVELEMLKAIECAMGRQLRIQNFFDIIVGTSTGGIITLGLGVENWSVDTCIETFIRLSNSAFIARPFHGLHRGKYKTKPYQEALQGAFKDKFLFGGKSDVQVKEVNVAITTTTQVDRQATILTNYNRLDTRNDPGYEIERAEDQDTEWKIWEVARATSAAPFYYKLFMKNQRRYADGGLYYNCPVKIAYQEQKLIWSDTSTQHLDILLSLGTGYDNETISQSNKFGLTEFFSRRPIGGFVSLCKHRISNSLNCKLEWDNFWNEFVGSDASADVKSRYVRLDPLFEFKQPELDGIEHLELLRTTTKALMKKQPYQKIIQNIVGRLIASTFFFQRSQDPTKVFDDEYECSGYIRCRFSNNTSEIRALGNYLLEKQTDTFQPYIFVEAEGLGPRLYEAQLSETIISDMRQRGKFAMEPITIETSRRFCLIRICLCLEEDTIQYPPVPISGFPRNFLAEEDMQKRRPRSLIQTHSGDSVKRLKKRQTNLTIRQSAESSRSPSSSLQPSSQSTLKTDSSQEDLEKRRYSPASVGLGKEKMEAGPEAKEYE